MRRLVALKTLEIIANSDKTISQIFDEIPKLVATPEIILSAPDATKFQIIQEISDTLAKQYDVITLDGVRASFSGGWGMVRASNTQPAITLRFEAYTKEQIVEYMKIFTALLDQYPDVDQTKLLEQVKMFS